MTSVLRHATPIHRRFISIDDLPTEVLEPILAAICQDKSSRWKLPLLNRSFNAQFTPLLYRSVVLTNLDQLHRFVRYASDSTTSQARRTAVVEELVISLPPTPASQDSGAHKCSSCKQDVPKRLPVAAGPLCSKQFGLLALGYSLSDIVAITALGGDDARPNEGPDSTFGLTDLTSDTSTARITLAPERDEDRRFLVISEAIRVCPSLQSLHLDVGTWDWTFDMYYSGSELTGERRLYGGDIKRGTPLPDGNLSYAECEDHRLVAALSGLQQLRHFTWTHSREHSYKAACISKRKMDVLAYGFDAMARALPGGHHPLESIRLQSPDCSTWRNDILPPCPTWRINLNRYLEPNCHSPHQRLQGPDIQFRQNGMVRVFSDYSCFQSNVNCRRDERHKEKSLAQVALGFGTHGHADDVNALNFPSLLHISLLNPRGLDLAEVCRLLCDSPNGAKVRITARHLDTLQYSSYGGSYGGAEVKEYYRPELELALSYWLIGYLIRMAALPIRDEQEEWRKRQEEWRRRDEERETAAKRIKLDTEEEPKKRVVPVPTHSTPISRLVGSYDLRLPWNSREEDASDREGLFIAAAVEKLCGGDGEGDVAQAAVSTDTQPDAASDRSMAHLVPSKPLWRLLSRIHFSTRPLADRDKDGAALQHAVTLTLIASANESEKRDLQAAQLADASFTNFSTAEETKQSLVVLGRAFQAIADVVGKTAPLDLAAAERMDWQEEEAAMASTRVQRDNEYVQTKTNSSSPWLTSGSDLARAARLDSIGLPFSPAFMKRRLLRLGKIVDKSNCPVSRPQRSPRFHLDLDELKLWGIDVRDALIPGGESDKDIDWAPAALKEREGKESTTAGRSNGAVYGGAGTGLPEFVRIPIFGGQVPRFVRARYA